MKSIAEPPVRWALDLPGANGIVRQPSIVGDSLLVAHTYDVEDFCESRLGSVKLSDGSTAWERTFAHLMSAPIATHDGVFCATWDGRVFGHTPSGDLQ